MNEHTTAIKIIEQTDTTATVGGYGVVFGGKDLDGDTFTPETDYDLDLVPVKRTYYDHTLGDVKHPLGEAIKVNADDVGLWVEAQLDRSREYVDAVLKLIEDGVIGWSSGSIAHLVRRDAGVIKSWPIAEFSLTPTPAEPRTLGVERIKQLAEHDPSLIGLVPQDVGNTSAISNAGGDAALSIETTNQPTPHTEVIIMTDETKTEAPKEDNSLKAFEARLEAIGAQMAQVLEFIEKSPPLKNAGYFTEDGGAQDATVKSFGDFLIAIKRNDIKRLNTIYSSVKDQTEGTGSQGGFLVPVEYSNQLIAAAAEMSQVVSRVTTVPVSTDSGRYPALDQFTAPTAGAGNTAYAGGVTAANTAEGATLTETDADFRQLEWNVHKVGGYTEVTNELAADSPQSIEALLRSLFVVAIAARNERNILRGSGVGEPLGILNSAAAISITVDTSNTFAYADAAEMLSRFKRLVGNPIWLIHPSIWPDIAAFEVGTGGAVWQANVSGAQPSNLLGYPVVQSEHLPQANYSGSVLLADLGSYAFFMRQQLTIAYSEHAAFLKDMGTFRFTQRNDGQPWQKAVITLADPQGSYTVSPFVYSDD